MRQCKECSEEFKPKRSNHVFCAKPCTDKYAKRKLDSVRACKCGATISRVAKSCGPCSPSLKTEKYIEAWLAGLEPGGTDLGLSETVRKYMLKLADYKCTVCGFDERHPSDGSCILEVDHIDGDGSNHRLENLRVLCPNHHTLTPTFRGRNRGNGRPKYYYRQRVRQLNEDVVE